jgi:hypothetical protein
MICRSLLRLIAPPTILVFVLFLVIQPEAIDARGGGGGERGGGGGAVQVAVRSHRWISSARVLRRSPPRRPVGFSFPFPLDAVV